jgi:hypothetical protein
MSDNISRKMNGKKTAKQTNKQTNNKANQQTKSRNEQSLSSKRNLFCCGKIQNLKKSSLPIYNALVI